MKRHVKLFEQFIYESGKPWKVAYAGKGFYGVTNGGKIEGEMSKEDAEKEAEKRNSADESLSEREFSDEKREELAKSGEALPDGSFPIVNVEDLKNAISAYGRAKDQKAAAQHIAKRAKALGKEDMIPQTKDFQDNLK